MSDLLIQAKSIFLEAAPLDEAARRELLDRRCLGDTNLRAHVEALLDAAQGTDDLLDQSRIEPAVTADSERIANSIQNPGSLDLELAGTEIGPYKLLQRIGEGGMGVVYMAEQSQPVKRRVALKIIKPGMDSRAVVARFEAERQALAMMDHPNIAKVLDAGTTTTGRPYFVMELVNGVPITEFCDQEHLTPRERLELFVHVCHAVQHAHQKGIIHRDIKPSNVLVASYDDHAVPKVIDFGVAKATSQSLTDKTLFTQFGQILGTVEYMSPEQSRRNQLDVDTRSDVYSLGVLLYELLTGVTPFERRRLREAAIDEILRILRDEEPPRPSIRLSSLETLPSVAANRRTDPKRLSSLLRGELDWIIMKAMEKERVRRYETANALGADVERYLNDEQVNACPPSLGYRFRKFARRHRAALIAIATVLLLMLAGTTGTSYGLFKAVQSQRIARAAAVLARKEAKAAGEAERVADQRSKQLAREVRSARASGLAAHAQNNLEERPILASLLAIEAAKATQDFGEPIVPIARQSLLEMSTRIGGIPLAGHEDIVMDSIVSPDDRWLFTRCRDRVGYLWNLSDKESMRVPIEIDIGLGGLDSARFTKEADFLFTYHRRAAKVSCWRLQDQRLAFSLPLPKHVERLIDFDVGPSGSLVAGLCPNREVLIWRTEDQGAQLHSLQLAPNTNARAIKFSSDGELLAAVDNVSVNLWDREAIDGRRASISWATDAKQGIAWGGVRGLEFDSNSEYLLTTGYQDRALLFDLRQPGGLTPVELGHGGPVSEAIFAAQGKRVITMGPSTSSDTRIAKIWDVNGGLASLHKQFSLGSSSSWTLSQDGMFWAAITEEAQLRVWDLSQTELDDGRLIAWGREFLREGLWPQIAISPDNQYLACGNQNSVALWDLAQDEKSFEPVKLLGANGIVRNLIFLSKQQALIVNGGCTPRYWNLESTYPSSSRRIPVPGGPLQYSPHGDWVVLGRQKAHLAALGANGIAVSLFPLQFNGYGSESLAINDDGNLLVTCDEQEGVAVLYDMRDPTNPRPMQTLDHPLIQCVALSGDGRWLVTGAGEQQRGDIKLGWSEIKVWFLADGEAAATSMIRWDSFSPVSKVRISPDEMWMATQSYGGQVRLWRLQEPLVAQEPVKLQNSVRSMDMSPDGRRLVIGGIDGVARVWALSEQGLIEEPIRLRHPYDEKRGYDHVWLTLWGRQSRILVTSGDLGIVFVWDLESADPTKPIRVIPGFDSSLRHAAIDASSRWLAVPSKDGVRLYDLLADSSMPPLVIRSRHPRGFFRANCGMLFSPDSRWLVTGSDSETTFWDLDTDRLIEHVKSLAGRDLTSDEREEFTLSNSGS